MTTRHRAHGDVAVLVPAAGLGVRMGPGRPKALRNLDGASLLSHALRQLSLAAGVGLVIVAAPPDRLDEFRLDLAGRTPPEIDLAVIAGGATRQRSVAAALAALGQFAPEPGACPVVLVHDAARALAPADLVERVAAAVRSGHDAVIPVLPVVDTVKRVDASGHVAATVDRSQLRAVQTPQGFRREVLTTAHRAAMDRGEDSVTDDAGLVERIGVRVFCVPGDEAALKITRPVDLALAEAMIRIQDTVNHDPEVMIDAKLAHLHHDRREPEGGPAG